MRSKRVAAHKKAYSRFLNVKRVRGCKVDVTIKQEAVHKAQNCQGSFALINNDIKESVPVLMLYRTKDVLEKGFANIKERLNCRRWFVSSEARLTAKLFVDFVALIIVAYINKTMQSKELYKKYTMPELLPELELRQSFCEPGRAPIIGEVLKKQRLIYEAMDILPPA